MWPNAKPPQAGGLTAATTEAANIAAPEVSPAIEDRATADDELSYDEVSHGSGDYNAFNMPLE